MKTVLNAHRAYERINSNQEKRMAVLFDKLDDLIKKARLVESNLFRKLKPFIALSLKWRFDFLCKTLESPFELEQDVEYWNRVMDYFKILGDNDWFDIDKNKKSIMNPWKRTADGFDLGWVTTTEGDRYKVSKKIAKERLDQIVRMLASQKQGIEGQEILDSGCGPGRYVDLMLGYKPKKITGMDQGERLIKVLKKRFENNGNVKIIKGTCQKLTFKDESFDIVFSNGVMHHTPSDLKTMLKDHARVLRKGGVMFIMLIGKGGLELKMWEFLRNFLYDIPLEEMLKVLIDCISPLRLQGVVDHMYGEYQETDRKEFENWCSSIFKRIERIPGIAGIDVTPELYQDDPYFKVRFGCGQLRYLCYK